MLYLIFKYYLPAFPLILWAPLVVIGFIIMVAACIMLGPPGRKSLDEHTTSNEKLILLGSSMIIGLIMFHLVGVILAGIAIDEEERLSNSYTPEPLTVESVLIAPSRVNHETLLTWAFFTVAIAIGAGVGNYAVITDGGQLRDLMHRLRDPSRERGDMGSAHFCLPGEFLRLQQPKEAGLELIGQFWGKLARKGIANKVFYRLDAGFNRGPHSGHGLSLSIEDQSRGMILVGPPGTGKSQAGILPIAADTMRQGHSVIMVDPQGELTEHIKRYAIITGHRVIIHDPTEPTLPSYNLATNIGTVMDAQAITKVLIPDTGHGGGGNDGFWNKAAQNLLAAMLMTFPNMGEILMALSDIEALAKTLAEGPEEAAILAATFIASSKTDGKIASNTLATLQASPTMSSWASDVVRQATSTTDFGADMLMDAPTVIILKCPGRYNKVFGPYLGAVLRRLMLDLDTIGNSYANDPDLRGGLPRPVKIILDEFPILGKLDAVVEAVNIFRKRRIGFLLAIQTISQLEMIYGKAGAESLIAGMATQIVFGSCDQPTAEFVQKSLGKTTDISWSKKEGTVDPTLRQRDLMTIDEVVAPARGSATIIFRYATSSYATQVVMYAELRPMYQRKDWQAKLKALPKNAEPFMLYRDIDDLYTPALYQPTVPDEVRKPALLERGLSIPLDR